MELYKYQRHKKSKDLWTFNFMHYKINRMILEIFSDFHTKTSINFHGTIILKFINLPDVQKTEYEKMDKMGETSYWQQHI